jgi:hypothetical protein
MNEEQQVVETPEVQEIDYKAFYEQNKDTIEKLPGLLNKQQELLAETKKAKEERRRIEELSKQEQQSLAEKQGKYEDLYKQTLEELKNERAAKAQEIQERRKEKINLIAAKVAADLAKGDADRAELLSVFVARDLQSVANDNGDIDNDVIGSIKKQFEADNKYKPLLGGNKSVGGSAPGNARGAGVESNKLTMAEFSKLTPQQKLNFSKAVTAGKAQLI